MTEKEYIAPTRYLLVCCILWSAFVMGLVDPQYRQWGVVISLGVFAVVGWCLVIPMLYTGVGRQWKRDNDLIDGIKSTFLSQEEVDRKLHVLAKKFDQLCTLQVQINGHEVWEARLKSVEDSITMAKSAFWAAHKLANELDFKVRRKVGDYLEADESECVQASLQDAQGMHPWVEA